MEFQKHQSLKPYFWLAFLFGMTALLFQNCGGFESPDGIDGKVGSSSDVPIIRTEVSVVEGQTALLFLPGSEFSTESRNLLLEVNPECIACDYREDLDFDSLSMELPPGSGGVELPLRVLDDSWYENKEVFRLVFRDSSDGRISHVVILEVMDNEEKPRLVLDNVIMDMESIGQGRGIGKVRLSTPLDRPVVFSWALGNDTGDSRRFFQKIRGDITIPAKTSEFVEFNLPLFGDHLPAIFTRRLELPLSLAVNDVDVVNETTPKVIFPKDGVAELFIGTKAVTEGVNFQFLVSLSQPLQKQSGFRWSIHHETTENSDFTGTLSGMMTFLPGERTGRLDLLTVAQADTWSPEKTFLISISEATANLSSPAFNGRGIIRQLSGTPYGIIEGMGVLTPGDSSVITVSLSRAMENETSVEIRHTESEALPWGNYGDHYVLSSSRLTIAAGGTMGSVTLMTNGDDYPDLSFRGYLNFEMDWNGEAHNLGGFGFRVDPELQVEMSLIGTNLYGDRNNRIIFKPVYPLPEGLDVRIKIEEFSDITDPDDPTANYMNSLDRATEGVDFDLQEWHWRTVNDRFMRSEITVVTKNPSLQLDCTKTANLSFTFLDLPGQPVFKEPLFLVSPDPSYYRWRNEEIEGVTYFKFSHRDSGEVITAVRDMKVYWVADREGYNEVSDFQQECARTGELDYDQCKKLAVIEKAQSLTIPAGDPLEYSLSADVYRSFGAFLGCGGERY